MTTSEQTIMNGRIGKIEAIRALGIEPYPHTYRPNTTAMQARTSYESGNPLPSPSVAGRIVAYRDHGSVAFAEVQDSTGRIQIYIQKDSLPAGKEKLLPLLDIGDFIGVNGELFKTRRGETTINVQNYEVLAKTIISPPEKWHGIQDPELMYRRRSEYLTSNPAARETFVKRSKAISAMREFLDGEGFLEVETPLIQPVYGGASAKPFKTHVNSIGEEYFMSISPELYLKRLIAGGFNSVYTICKNFRNEGLDRTHNPEFTMMECYKSYADYNDMMRLTEDMYAHIFQKVAGSTKVKYRDPETDKGEVELDFTPPWKRVPMLDIVREITNIDASNMSEQQLRERISQLEDKTFFEKAVPREHIERWSWGELVQALFSHYCEHTLIQPTFVIDHPKETTPLCKIHRKDSRLIERFEPFVYGWEIGNAYSELNDPIRQRSLLEDQVKGRTNDEIPGEVDEDFCRAIEFGIPPTGGLGLGVDRLAMLLTNAYAIKDVILFPLLKRENVQNGGNA